MMISGDVRAAAGVKGEFYEMIRHFHPHWDRIDVVCPRAAGASARTIFGRVHLHPAGCFVYPDLRAKLTQSLASARVVKELFNSRPYDLMTVHEVPPFLVSWAAIRLARRRGISVVSEILHVEGHPLAPDLRHRLRRMATSWWVGYLRGRVQAFRAINSIEVPAYLRERGVVEEKIKVLYALGLDLEVFRPKPTERNIDFLLVGRLAPNKGLDLFLDGLSLIRERHPEVGAVIIGHGPLEGRLRSRIGAMGLSGNVRLISWVKDKAELAGYYRRAKALVVCSFAEGGPRVAFEALACGTPVIGPAIGALAEFLSHGVNGLVVAHTPASLAKAMERFLDEPGLSDRLGAAGPQIAARFEARRTIGVYAQGLKQVALAGAG